MLPRRPDDAADTAASAAPDPGASDGGNAVVRRPVREWLLTPAAVWCGFAVVHVYFLCWMASFFLHGWAFSDTEQYREWAMAGYNAPVTDAVSPWVYPVLAQVPIMFPRIAGYDLYLLAWTLMITALNAVAMWFLLHRAPRSGGRIHEGFDITAACGEKLVAVRSGRVLRSGYDAVLYGNFLLIHGEGERRSYFYAHLVRPAAVRRGQRVLEGQGVGAVGETGNAVGTGCHLHFEIQARGAPVDPEPALHRWDRYS